MCAVPLQLGAQGEGDHAQSILGLFGGSAEGGSTVVRPRHQTPGRDQRGEAAVLQIPQTSFPPPLLTSPLFQTLVSFLLPGHGRLRSQIEEVLDLPLIQQQAENGALDISQLSQFIVWMMGSLCAPSRDEDIQKLKQITEIVPLLK